MIIFIGHFFIWKGPRIDERLRIPVSNGRLTIQIWDSVGDASSLLMRLVQSCKILFKVIHRMKPRILPKHLKLDIDTIENLIKSISEQNLSNLWHD